MNETPRFHKAYLDCLDGAGQITRLEPLYHLCKQLEIETQHMKAQRNPNGNKFVLPAGYRDIGWQVTREHPDKKKCHEAGHTMKDGQITEFDNSLFMFRCTDVIRLCSVCKIADHTDMSG